MSDSVRICVIGSGVAGGTVSQELLAAGINDILMIEQGPKIPMHDRRKWYDVFVADQNPFQLGMPDSKYNNIGKSKYDLGDGVLLQGRGGSTVHWDGWAYRLRPEDFRLKSHTGIGIDWPISYDQLEPFYAEAEKTLQVAGDAHDQGHPPRSSPFPLPAFAYQLSDDPFLAAMDKLGFSVQHHCISRNTLPINGRPQCQAFGTCEYCPLGARFTGDQLIDRLEKIEGFRLMTNTSVRRILFGSKKQAVAVEVVDQESGRAKTIEAEKFVLCGGGIQSPKLLLQSTNRWWSKGIGNEFGHVGLYLMNHSFSSRRGEFSPNPKHFVNEMYPVDTAKSRYFDSEHFQSEGKFLLSSSPRSRSGGHYAIQRKMFDGFSVPQINEQLDKSVDWVIGGLFEAFPDSNNFIRLGKTTDSLGDPSLEVSYSHSEQAVCHHNEMTKLYDSILKAMGCEVSEAKFRPEDIGLAAHHMGTCRMSRLPEDGVVDENLKVHGVDNFFVCGSAVFPTGGAVNPTLTIVALAHRLGRYLSTL